MLQDIGHVLLHSGAVGNCASRSTVVLLHSHVCAATENFEHHGTNTKQSPFVPCLLSSRTAATSQRRRNEIYVANSGTSGLHLFATRSPYCHNQRRPSRCQTASSSGMGEYVGNSGHGISRRTIYTADMDDMAPWTCRQFKHSNDDDTDSW